MAEILAFPSEGAAPPAAPADTGYDRFLLDEGLELLGDFRSIQDRGVRDSLRLLIKSMALASRRTAAIAD